MRANLVLRDIGLGLRRNLTMTFAVIITVAISLALLGAGWLISKQVDVMKGFWYDKIEVSVFLKSDVTQAQRDSLGDQLRGDAQVERVFYESKTDAFARFQEQFKDSPDLVQNVTPEDLPESYRVKLKDPENFAVVQSSVAGLPGVDQVVDQQQYLNRFFSVINGFRTFVLVVSAFLVAAAILQITNTIRLAALNRRRETGIMKLVGASNFYVQLPFLLEGAIAGLVGAGFASVGVVLLKSLYVDKLKSTQLGRQFQFVDWADVLTIIPWLLLLGVAVSGLSSYLALRRHLRV